MRRLNYRHVELAMMAQSSEKYPNNPIREALCEFRFPQQGAEWNWTIPGLVFEQLKYTFPKRRAAKSVDWEITQEEEAVSHRLRPSDRVHLLSEDERRIAQLAPNLLVVNQLKPYPTWEEYKPSVLEVLKEYTNIAKPERIEGAALRYINIIDFSDQQTVPLQEYFNFRPVTGGDIPTDWTNFGVFVQVSERNEKDSLLIDMRTSPKGNRELILDLRYSLADQDGLSVQEQDVHTWLEQAHDRIEVVFESCITDNLRERFRKKDDGS